MVSMKIQSKIRDALVDIFKAEAMKTIGHLTQDHPEWKSDYFLTSTKAGSNQYQSRADIKFGFNNEEADALESGTEAKPFKGTFIQNVREHKRELGKPKTRTQRITRKLLRKKPKITSVKQHSRVYRDMKPVQLPSGEWRILRGTPTFKGKKLLEKQFNKFVANEGSIARQLKQKIQL